MKAQQTSQASQNAHDGTNASSSVKKSSSSFFEKHAFASGAAAAGAQQTNFPTSGGNVVSKIPSVSSSYNMHRQNATRGDSNLQGASSANNSSGSQVMPANSRDKPSAKQFSQNMLSKSQQFGSLQFSQQILSQQSYLAQGNIGTGPGVSPQMQQQNFIGSGLINAASVSLITSASQLNNSDNYDAAQMNNNSHLLLEQKQVPQSGQTGSPSKRQTKSSMAKPINPAHVIFQGGQNSANQSGLPLTNSTSSQQLNLPSTSSIDPKRYSVSGLSGFYAQPSSSSGNSALPVQQILDQQLAKQGNLSKSESNNKLRRISNMKKGEKSNDSNLRNQGLILTNNQVTSASGNVSQGQTVGQQYTQSSNPNLVFMQQQVQPKIIVANASSNLKSTTTYSGGIGGAPGNNLSNMTSFQQSHSERTSLTDDAHTQALIQMQWQVRDGQNAHAQCSTERYTNDQRVRFMQKLHSSNETLVTSQTSGTYPENASNAAGIISKKKANEKLFFVTDHKLYENQNAQIVSNDSASEHSGSGGSNAKDNEAYTQHPQMMYDIDMENIQVKAQNIGNPQMTGANKHTPSSLYNQIHKAQKKGTVQQQMLLSNSVIDQNSQVGSDHHIKGAAAAPLNKGVTSKQNYQSIVCPIYQSKDFRLLTGQGSNTTKNSAIGSHNVFNVGSKSDQKDVKRSSADLKDSNKGGTSGQVTAAKRSMSDDMHEDVYMAKSDHQKPRKRSYKASHELVEQVKDPNNSAVTHQNSSVNSSDAYERSHYKQLKKNSQPLTAKNAANNSRQWMQDEQSNQSGHHYSETSNAKIMHERREAEPLADKLLYLTNQACQSKIKSKSHMTQSMKSSQGLRKGLKSPNSGSQSTLQEPSAKAMPTSSKVKISQKFNKFEHQNPAMKIPAQPVKQNLFQTKTLKKQGSGPINDFNEFQNQKSPDVRQGAHVKKTGSISYAILPRHVNAADLKNHKKMKSPSPHINNQLDNLQRMRSPNTTEVKNQNSYNSGVKSSLSVIENLASNQSKDRIGNGSQQALLETRRLSQQRSSNISQRTPQINTDQNKSHLIESTGVKQYHHSSVTNSMVGSKRISFTDLHTTNKVLSNDGADEAKKLYCMVDSRKNSQTSLHNVTGLGQGLSQVQIQILQVDSQGNNKSNLNKVQLKTKDKLQTYMKPAGFLSQSPKAKKHPTLNKQNSAMQQQSSMLITHGSSITNQQNTSQSKLHGIPASSKQQKHIHQMNAAYASANHHLQREILKTSASGTIIGQISVSNQALLQIQAPKVVHLQSPPSRILIKASPRVSPNHKIRKQGIQTCKVSIDTLSKNGGSAQQKVNRANSKEFLKTIKLMKRGSNSPTSSTGPQHITSHNGSPDYLHLNGSNSVAPAGFQSSNLHLDTSTQLKNYNQNQKERQSSQNSNSTMMRQTSQNNKLFSRLQLRRAKDAQLSSLNNNPHELVSFSERQSLDNKAQSSATVLNPSVLSGQYQQIANQKNEMQYQSLPDSQQISLTSQLYNISSQQANSLVPSKQSSVKTSKGNKEYKGATQQSVHLTREKGLSKERPVSQLMMNTGMDPFEEKGQGVLEKQQPKTSQVSEVGQQKSKRQILQTSPTKKHTTSPVPKGTLPEEVKGNPEILTRATVQKAKVPKTENDGTPQILAQPIKERPMSKQKGFNYLPDDELREQAQFAKDLEKLKKMMRLHFKNYNSPPPTSSDFYRIGRVLGKGAFGKVSLAMHKLAEQLVAIKSMSKETLQCEVDQRRRTKLEMGILKQCNHPNVVRLFDTFETQKHICFVIELCSGGDLFSYIKKRRRLKEDVARFFFKQLVEGLAYIHNAKKVVHRDIKLENILLDATGNVKICDFGVSRQLNTGKERMKEQCGTPAYIAPEILLDNGYTGFNVDMWSAGVCLYAMLIGSVPFKASTMEKLQSLIIKGEYDFKFQTNANSKQLNNPKAATTLLSDEVQDLIAKLLQTDPEKRLTAVETLQHPWLQNGDPNLDVYTDKEKQLIQREYMRLNLKLSSGLRTQSGMKSTNSRIQMTPSQSNMRQETEQVLFTEHNLETKMGDEEANLANQEEKSFILAPFNSVKSIFIDQGNQIKEVKKDDPPYNWPKDVTDFIVPRRVIKFSTKCREKNRIYEQNNNADLDNGVYNEFVNEQEREEGALMNNAVAEEGKEDYDPNNSFQQVDSDSSEEENGKSKRKHVTSFFTGAQNEEEQESEDSLEKSFKETELASDDEEAEQQMRNAKQINKKVNEQAMKMLQKSSEDDENLDEDMQSHEDVIEKPIKPLNKKATSGAATLVPTTPVLSKQKSKTQLRQTAPTQRSSAVVAYQEPEFITDLEVVQKIQAGNVIPRWYLLQELQALTENNKDKVQKLSYVTATYFLLVKRKELVQLQRRQEGRDSRLETPTKEMK